MKKSAKKVLKKKSKKVHTAKLIQELEKTYLWHKRGIGYINSIKESIRRLQEETLQSNIYKLFKDIEQENIIQEMIEWKQINCNKELNQEMKKIYDIVEAFILFIDEKYGLEPIDEVKRIIDTPFNKRGYSFQNRIDTKLKKSVVLKPGLKIKGRIISPALLGQLNE